jgi:hypothetical protein
MYLRLLSGMLGIGRKVPAGMNWGGTRPRRCQIISGTSGGAMKDWPRLSVASLKAIELAEQEAESFLRSSVRPYTPGGPNFQRTTDNLREGGYRAIDYICAYAETLFDAFAGEYKAVATTVLCDVLAQRVVPEVEKKACNHWLAWLLATSIVGIPTVGGEATAPGGIRLAASPELVGQGIKNLVVHFAEKPSDPKLAPILQQLQERFRTQLQNLLHARIHDWESKGTEKSAEVGVPSFDKTEAQPQSPPERRALVNAFILQCKQVTSLKATRTLIWRAAGHSTARQFEFWQASDQKATAQDDQNFRRILAMSPTDFEVLLKKKSLI